MVLMVGWDFDFEIDMLLGESDVDGQVLDGFLNKVGLFLDVLVECCFGLDIYLLKWSGGVLIVFGGILFVVCVKFMFFV